jgi:heat-inducible transcriptional repressor
MTKISQVDESLNPRHRRVLFSTIAEYIATGRPVSSGALVKKHKLGLSPATVRRDFRTLCDGGFLLQQHTSSGRVPTDRAFRIFADTLKGEAGEIDSVRRNQLLQGLDGLLPGGRKSWQDAVKLISDLSYQAALVVTPALSEAVLRQLRFVPTGPNSLLAVIITREGLVHNTYIKASAPQSERELERVHNYLGGLIEGRTLNEIRKLLREELEDARGQCDALREQATLLGSEAIKATVEQHSELLVEGRSHLLARPELKDRMEELMRVLEEKGRILDLLDRAAESDHGPVVIIGQEAGEGFDGCAVITAPFGSAGSGGQVGVIGSTRMDYSGVIPLVALAAQFLSSRLSSEED